MSNHDITYGLVNSENEIIEYRNDIDADVITKAGFRWLPVITSDHPEYNSQTQYMVGPIYNLQTDHISQEWHIVNKTSEEIEAEKITKIISIDQNVFNILLMHENKFRELESNTPLTKEEYILYLKDFF